MPECRQEQVDNVRFLGTLTIKSLSWLTDPAKHAINKELRDRESRSRSNKHRLGVNNLTLETLYAPSLGFESAQPRIKVTIIAKKNMTSTYLSCKTTFLIHGRAYGLKLRDSIHNPRRSRDTLGGTVSPLSVFTPTWLNPIIQSSAIQGCVHGYLLI